MEDARKTFLGQPAIATMKPSPVFWITSLSGKTELKQSSWAGTGL
jgi:hypothetical protein